MCSARGLQRNDGFFNAIFQDIRPENLGATRRSIPRLGDYVKFKLKRDYSKFTIMGLQKIKDMNNLPLLAGCLTSGREQFGLNLVITDNLGPNTRYYLN